MAAPRSRISNARKNSRRSHNALKPKMFSKCSNCAAIKLPHRICGSCGYYDGRAVVIKKEKAES